jgi:hypothetical protein
MLPLSPLTFGCWILQNVHYRLIDPRLLFITDKAYFHLSGYINFQNTLIKSCFLSGAITWRKAWSVVCCKCLGNNQSNIFLWNRTLRSTCSGHTETIFQTGDWQRWYGCFQQDGATAHTANNSMRVLWEVFGDRIIRAGFWPLSLDLSICDLYLWGNLKGKVYKNNLHTAESLQNEMRNVTGLIAADKLQCVLHGFLRWWDTCLKAIGDHFEPCVIAW